MKPIPPRSLRAGSPHSHAAWSIWVMSLGLTIFMGCMAPRGITIIDTATYTMKSFPPPGDTWYTTAVDVDRHCESVLSIAESGNQIEIIKQDTNGQILSRRPV